MQRLIVKAQGDHVKNEITPIELRIHSMEDPMIATEYKTRFNAPKP
jgi:hypothetical protein